MASGGSEHQSGVFFLLHILSAVGMLWQRRKAVIDSGAFVCCVQYYLKTGTCKFGATCKYHHPREKAGSTGRVHLNVLGLPLRQVGSPKPAWEWVLAGRAMQHSLVGMLCLYALGVLE